MSARLRLDLAAAFHDEPARANQTVAHYEPHPAHETERREPVERAAGKLTAAYPYSLQQPAEHYSLRERRNGRAGCERNIPFAVVWLGNPAKLECDAAEHECEQHHDQRHVQGGGDDRVCEGKRDEEPAATEYEPGLVAIPKRRDGVHHVVAVGLAREDRKQDSQSKIESVEHDVQRDRTCYNGSGDQWQPIGGEVCVQMSGASARDSRVGSCAVASGRFGKPSRPGGGATDAPCGPWRISLRM